MTRFEQDQEVRLQGLHVASRRQGEEHVIGLTGELDLANVAGLQSEVLRVESSECSNIVFDLRGLEFLDSTGVHLLAEAHRRATGRGSKVSVAVDDGPVRRVLQVSGMLDVLGKSDSRAVAA